MRICGRWSNEAGAHAGFTALELSSLCRNAFGDARNIEDEYYLHLYRSHAGLLRAIIAFRGQSLTFPSVYVLGIKPL